jgi:hypothetical protein
MNLSVTAATHIQRSDTGLALDTVLDLVFNDFS